MDLKLPIFGFSILGQSDFWPTGSAPGRPATVRFDLYAVDAWNQRVAAGATAGATAREVSELTQTAMQASVAGLAATMRC